MTIRLLLVDDHAVVRSGLRMLLESEADVEIVGEAGTAREALRRRDGPQAGCGADGHRPARSCPASRPRARSSRSIPRSAIVALTIHEDEEYFFKMLEAGASGYVPKRAAPEELLTAIQAAAERRGLSVSLAGQTAGQGLSDPGAGRPRTCRTLDGLTEREQEVLAHLADGASNAEIAEALQISPKTVARHRENIMRKLNLHSRAELVKYAIRKGIIRP